MLMICQRCKEQTRNNFYCTHSSRHFLGKLHFNVNCMGSTKQRSLLTDNLATIFFYIETKNLGGKVRAKTHCSTRSGLTLVRVIRYKKILTSHHSRKPFRQATSSRCFHFDSFRHVHECTGFGAKDFARLERDCENLTFVAFNFGSNIKVNGISYDTVR